MIKRVVVLFALCALLFACVQQPQSVSQPPVQPTADEGEPVGFVTDSLTLQDLPTSQEVGLLDVILDPCRTEDGPYQRYNSTADARVNAVQFNAQIPTSTSLPSDQPGYVYGGGYSNTNKTMDFGVRVNADGTLGVFMKMSPAPAGTTGFFTLDLQSQLTIDGSKFSPPVTAEQRQTYSKIYPVLTNPGSSTNIEFRIWTTSSAVYLQITTPMIIRMYADRSTDKATELNNAVPKPAKPFLPEFKTLIGDSSVKQVLPVVTFPITGWGEVGTAQAMKVMTTIGQRQYDPLLGKNVTNPSAGQSFTGININSLTYGTATANGTFTAKTATAAPNLSCPNPPGVVTAPGSPTTATGAAVSINANLSVAVLSVTAPPDGTPLVLEARPGDAKIPGEITVKNAGSLGSLLRVNFGKDYSNTWGTERFELVRDQIYAYKTPLRNCPATATPQPPDRNVYIRALDGATEQVSFTGADGKVSTRTQLKFTPDKTVAVQLKCTGSPALGTVTVTYTQTPPKAPVGKTVTGSASFKNNGTRPLEWTASLPGNTAWLKLNPVSGTTAPGATAKVAFTATCSAVGQFTTDITITNKNVPEQKSTARVTVDCERTVRTSLRVTTPYNGVTQLCPRLKGAIDYEFVGVTGSGTWEFYVDGLPVNAFAGQDSGSTLTFDLTRSCNFSVGSHALTVKVVDSQGVVLATSAPATFMVTDNRWTGFVSNMTNNCVGIPGTNLDLSVTALGVGEQRQNAVAAGGALAFYLAHPVSYTFRGQNTALSVDISGTGTLPNPFDGDPQTVNGRTGFSMPSFTSNCPDPTLARTTQSGQQSAVLVPSVPPSAPVQSINVPIRLP